MVERSVMHGESNDGAKRKTKPLVGQYQEDHRVSVSIGKIPGCALGIAAVREGGC